MSIASGSHFVRALVERKVRLVARVQSFLSYISLQEELKLF